MPTKAWEAEPNPSLVKINEEGWVTVQDMFDVDVEIRVDRENLSTGPVLTSNPASAPCTICAASRQEDRLKYINSRVFVRTRCIFHKWCINSAIHLFFFIRKRLVRT